MPCSTEFSIGQRVKILEVVEKGERNGEIGKDRCVGMTGTLTMVRFDQEKGLHFYVEFNDSEREKHKIYCNGALALKICGA